MSESNAHYSETGHYFRLCCVQRVQATRSSVSVMECVFQHVSCVMDTLSVVTTVTKTTALTTTVCTYM